MAYAGHGRCRPGERPRPAGQTETNGAERDGWSWLERDDLYLPRLSTAPAGMGVSAVRVSRITGTSDPNPRWYLGSVEVEDRATGDSQTFTADRWIDVGRYAGWHS